MRPSIVLMAVSCWIMPCTIAAAQTRCVVIAGTADALGKDNAVEKSVKSLREARDVNRDAIVALIIASPTLGPAAGTIPGANRFPWLGEGRQKGTS